MKVKFRFGIKSYSGTVDEMTYSNYESRDVVIARMYNPSQVVTANNVAMGNKMIKIGEFYQDVEPLYKADLESYATKMFNLPAFQGKLSGNKFSVFVKLLWAASKAATNPIAIDSISIDDASLGSYPTIETISAAIAAGLLPDVADSDLYVANLAPTV